MIVSVNQSNIHDAAIIHSVSWQDSHRSFCSADFIAMHTPEHQEAYLQTKIDAGSKVFMLIEQNPIGIVSLTNSMIEDLYVLPDKQNMGYGTKLLQFAVEQCNGKPTLWILENNANAKCLYLKMGFQETGRIKTVADGFDEIELSLP